MRIIETATAANCTAGASWYAGPGGHRGELTAWDVAAGHEVWTIEEDFPVWSGAAVAAGDLVFYGTMDGWFQAVHAETGEPLWQFKVGSGIVGQPTVSRGPDGKQYVAILSGVGGWRAPSSRAASIRATARRRSGSSTRCRTSRSTPAGAGCSMSSRCRSALRLIALAALAPWGCEREERDYRPTPADAARDQTISVSALQAGGASPPVLSSNEYEESAYAVAEGKRRYRWYNCNGCHANGGGGSGPPLMDDKWIYGSAPANIVATILEGRPNGMPSFRGKIPDHQAMQIAGYVRSMSGMLAQDVAPGRSDHLSAKKPEASTEKLTPKDSALSPSAQVTQ